MPAAPNIGIFLFGVPLGKNYGLTGGMNTVASHIWQFKSYLQKMCQHFEFSKATDVFQDSKTIAISVGALVTLGVVGAGVYATTRTCAVGDCPMLEQSKLLHSSTFPLSESTASMESISETYTTLLDMNYQLEAVPTWSRHYQQTQFILINNEKQADVLAQVLVAQQLALDAAIASQSPPHPLNTWQTIATGWQEAIAHLEDLATEATVAPLVQVKIEEYTANLAIVQQRIQQETDAGQTVMTARAALYGVNAYETQSPERLQAAQAALQTALAQLTEVPTDTMAAAEAEHLLAIYQPQLITVSDRLQAESQSTQLYTHANTSAERALASEQTQQWSAAVKHWHEATIYIQQIPKGTAYHDQVRPLLTTYSSALNQAQQRLDQLMIVEQTQQSLEQRCTTVAQICQRAESNINNDPTQSASEQPTVNVLSTTTVK